MSGPYDLSGKRSVAECLPMYTLRNSQLERGPYEPIGLTMLTPLPEERPVTHGHYEPARIHGEEVKEKQI